MNPLPPLAAVIISVLKNLPPCACVLWALSAHAEPDLSAPEATGPGWNKRGLPVETCTQPC